MNRQLIVPLVTASFLAASPALADRAFELQLGAAYAASGPLASPEGDPTSTVRLYPGEPLELTITGFLASASAGALDNAVLTGELAPCVLIGAAHPEIAAGEPLDCVSTGVAWTRTAVGPMPHHLHAAVKSNADPLPPGEYTLLFMLEDESLRAILGCSAPTLLRSNPLRIIVGPTTNGDEQLTKLHRAASRALAAGNWADAIARAGDLLVLYPFSIDALCILGEAQAARGNTSAAIAAFTTARSILDAGADVKTPAHASPHAKVDIGSRLDQAIEELAVPE
jgi:hypothetical protein